MGTLGAEPGTCPTGCPAPLSGLRSALCLSRNKEGRRSVPTSARKASQRSPRPSLAPDSGGKRSQGPVGCAAAFPQRRLLRGGVWCGRAGRGPDTRRRSVGRRSVGITASTARLEDSGGRRSSPSVEPRNLAARSERAAREGPPNAFQRRVRGSPLPPSPLSARGLSGSAAGFALLLPQPLPPPLAPPALLFGWVITGCSCRGAQKQPPRFCVCRPSRQQPGPCPPAGGPATLHRSFPFGPKLCPGFVFRVFVCLL